MELRVSRILWVAILGAAFLLLGVLVLWDQSGPVSPTTLPLPVLGAVGAAALVDAALSVLLQKHLRAGAAIARSRDARAPPGERLFAERPRRARLLQRSGPGAGPCRSRLPDFAHPRHGAGRMRLPAGIRAARPTEVEAGLERVYEADLG